MFTHCSYRALCHGVNTQTDESMMSLLFFLPENILPLQLEMNFTFLSVFSFNFYWKNRCNVWLESYTDTGIFPLFKIQVEWRKKQKYNCIWHEGLIGIPCLRAAIITGIYISANFKFHLCCSGALANTYSSIGTCWCFRSPKTKDPQRLKKNWMICIIKALKYMQVPHFYPSL